nr:MAG TPA: hypothetical protein [Bacteriophage sp.]
MTWQTLDGFELVENGIQPVGNHSAVCVDACGKSIQQSRGNRLVGGRVGLNFQRCRLHGEIVHELLTVRHFITPPSPAIVARESEGDNTQESR